MIFLAQGLPMNGGTTFLIRITQALARAGRPCAVILLRDDADPGLLSALRAHAHVVRLSDYQIDRGRVFRQRLAIFGPIDWKRLSTLLGVYGSHVHAMGLFGLLFALRWRRRAVFVPSVGVYHQNEFVYQHWSYLRKKGEQIFAALPEQQIIFFNEITKRNYGHHFDCAFAESPLLPIGIMLPSATASRERKSWNIVSVGNLEGFKTYNRHMIGLMPALMQRYPEIRYDIYGTGPEQAALERLIAELALDGRVRLMGRLDYSHFSAIVSEADVFVGSGTALIEAAALGRPAIIGIESIPTPETYGFLSHARGFSYHEAGLDLPLRSLISCVDEVLSDPERYDAVAKACVEKAATFSIEQTAIGFLTLAAQKPRPERSYPRVPLRMLISFIGVGILTALGLSNSFNRRRNQSI